MTEFLTSEGLQDIWADGIARAELIEPNVRVLYWRWVYENGVWRKSMLDFAMVLPLKETTLAVKRQRHFPVISPPNEIRAAH